MQKDDEELDGAYAAFDRGIAEANRRNAGDFDGVMGNFEGLHSKLLTDICHYLRDYLLDRYTEEDARELLRTHMRMSRGEGPDWYAKSEYDDVGDDIRLVLTLVNTVASALRVDPEFRDELILGKAGVRDKKREAGALKGRKESAKQRRENAWENWQGDFMAAARKMLSEGSPERKRHQVIGILASKQGKSWSGKSPEQLRRVLKEHLSK